MLFLELRDTTEVRGHMLINDRDISFNGHHGGVYEACQRFSMTRQTILNLITNAIRKRRNIAFKTTQSFLSAQLCYQRYHALHDVLYNMLALRILNTLLQNAQRIEVVVLQQSDPFLLLIELAL